jgi:hypothetical protein
MNALINRYLPPCVMLAKRLKNSDWRRLPSTLANLTPMKFLLRKTTGKIAV